MSARTEVIISVALGIALALWLFVYLPMKANYEDHGSVFAPSEPKWE